jgi:DNA-binding IclR family transcriptional regulator
VLYRPQKSTNLLACPSKPSTAFAPKLEHEGFLAREEDGKKLRPTRRSRLMASGLLHASRNHIARHQVMQRVADEVGETVNFVVPDSAGMIYVGRVETDWPFRVQLPVGTHVPFHCTASGKTFLASLAPKARQAMVRSLQLKNLTPNTLCTEDALLSELKLVAKKWLCLGSRGIFHWYGRGGRANFGRTQSVCRLFGLSRPDSEADL